jgi:hypothetical protein
MRQHFFRKVYKHFTITSKFDPWFITTPHISIGLDKNSWRGIAFAFLAFDITFHYHSGDPDLLSEWEEQNK